MRATTAALLAAILALALQASSLAGPGFSPPEPAPPAGGFSLPLLPPVDGTLTRRFVAPRTDWGPGHRGVDLASAPGAPVRAAASGEVTFAGVVGSLRAVTIAHEANLETTYSSLDDIYVRAGDQVGAGDWLGSVATAHPDAEGGLHFGVKHLGRYVDPELHLGPLDLNGAIYLVPDHHVHASDADRRRNGYPLNDGSGDCAPRRALTGVPPAPTDNLAVVVGGHNSGSGSPIFGVPARLGYSPQDVYRFSYRGLRGSRFFEPYEDDDTRSSLTQHAFRFRSLLRAIGRTHPGRGIDVFAHSQGGLLVRDALSSLVSEWDPAMPRVENVVTYGTPHQGTRLANAPDVLEGGSATFLMLDVLHATGGLDPWSEAVNEVTPGSAYLSALAASGVTLGTRGLALSIPNDVVVPAHRARWDEELSRAVPPAGLWGHDALPSSVAADQVAYDFLRGATPCEGPEGLARDLGRLVSGGHAALPWVLRGIEQTAERLAGRTPLGGAVVGVVEGVADFRRRMRGR